MLRIYNTMTRRIEEFKPLKGNRVYMYVCGPTVYDYSHIGHARTYIAYDVIARYLREKGYSVFYLMNITDVDDKIIRRAGERGVNPIELAREYERYFMEDMDALGIQSVNLYARASEYIDEIVDLIKVLMDKEFAYETETGVYFDTSRFKDYGKLSHKRPEELLVHRIEPDPTKKNPADFALWKKRDKDEIGWDSPWGYGRPGWHIEDTAIILTHFGPQIDIHGGAIELTFPHHEAEIAQAEAATGKKPFVRYWCHTGLLTVGGEKMKRKIIPIAKSLRRMGFKIYATEHTAEALVKAGLNPITVLHKVKEERKPNILDYLLERKIDLVINIPTTNSEYEHSDVLEDEYTIRRLAVEFNIPILTTIELASALVRVLKYKANSKVTIRSLNEYMDRLPFKHW